MGGNSSKLPDLFDCIDNNTKQKRKNKIKNTKIKLLDTRKTTPGWRLIEKYSVKVGGGNNHRLDLSKLILIKDNHIKFCNGIDKALKKLQKAKGFKKILHPGEPEFDNQNLNSKKGIQ